MEMSSQVWEPICDSLFGFRGSSSGGTIIECLARQFYNLKEIKCRVSC